MGVQESKYPEWRTAYILTGELLETVKQIGVDSPVPWIVGECASSCLSVLLNPMHKLYGKVNKFIQKAPSWEVEKIPSYWIDKILLHEPELDDGYFEEITWLLDLLVKGLRTERVCSMGTHKLTTTNILSRIWRSIAGPMFLNEYYHSTSHQVLASPRREEFCICCIVRFRSRVAQRLLQGRESSAGSRASSQQ